MGLVAGEDRLVAVNASIDEHFFVRISVVDGLERLNSAVSDFEAEADFDFVDPKQLAAVIDRLQGALCKVLDRGRERGDHRLAGLSPASWAARTCGLSRKAAADRLCVGRQLGSLPETAAALAGGAISYQAASALCHLREQLGERWQPANEAEVVGFAHSFSIEDFHICCRHARHVADPDGFDTDSKEDFERRWLQVSPMLDGMHSVDGVLDPVTGAAFRTALDALAGWRGPGDTRNQSQHMADALAELLDHHMNEGLLPRRKGVRPHVSLTTTLPGLKRELGAPAAELELGMPISGTTVERLACDCTMSRVLMADCHFHHRLVHEGEWQIVKAGDEFHVIPPERLRSIFVRGPDVTWAA